MFVCKRSSEVREVVSESSDESENERTKDRKERDEFASRLKKKDAERTRKVMSKSEQKVGQCW